jgi:ABA sandwich protein
MADPLPPGRELDALVAEKVMGWIDVKKQSIANAFGQHVMDDHVGLPAVGAPQPVLVPRYSTMIQEAWKVADKLRGDVQFVAVISGKGPQGVQPWICKVNREGSFLEERADTAAHAICLAALKGVSPTT